MTKISPYLLLALIVMLVSCSSNSKEPASNSQSSSISAHNSQNSLDWRGTYSGVLPCASCEGIKTQITLRDSTYEISLSYLGEDTSGNFIQTDFFSWNEAGNMITLDNREAPNKYFVGENMLIHLNQNGERVSGDLADKYILSKEPTD